MFIGQIKVQNNIKSKYSNDNNCQTEVDSMAPPANLDL